MDTKERDRLRWLWDNTDDSDILDKVAEAICRKGDIEDLKWLWDRTPDDSDTLKNVAEAICRKGDIDTLKRLWDEAIDFKILDMVAEAICRKGDIYDLKWLWDETKDSDILKNVAEAICREGDIEDLNWLWDETEDSDIRNKVADAITSFNENSEDGISKVKTGSRTKKGFNYDCFICHASEDKESCVKELVEKLRKKGYNIWYDEFTLTLGDSLRRKIDHGLANSRYGIVVLSKYFFEKKWPQDELDGLVAKERLRKKVILPIWHGVTKEDVLKFSPILAGRLAVSTNKGLDNVVREIIRAIK